MGVILKYTCKHCSFVADKILEGFGFTVTEETFLCKDCGSAYIMCGIIANNEFPEKAGLD